ncbi:hypothetical protein KDAU_31820 [Dictyobacter aurantiacus]|uniref:Uncharacterized protein n=1 Tax=Dictyobacter aurantiacus TaxID=1936993 RepID=A0A401ZGC1_9CHLR|nr:hypothetical protein KDAU_31820 [Dictyobacter aurantiacus]
MPAILSDCLPADARYDRDPAADKGASSADTAKHRQFWTAAFSTAANTDRLRRHTLTRSYVNATSQQTGDPAHDQRSWPSRAGILLYLV